MIVTSPTDDWLIRAIEGCRDSFSVSSPYVGKYLSDVVSQLDGTVSVTLLTRTTLADFASRASDLNAVCSLARRAGSILSLSALHAKVYVVGKKRALITSANSTYSGMHRNRECGYEITKRAEVLLLDSFIKTGFGTRPIPQRWTLEDLDQLRDPVARLRASIPRVATLRGKEVEALLRINLSQQQYRELIESFSGWLQLTLQGISRIASHIFTMNDVMAACAPLAIDRFPENRHVREKLRQQMQRLRDLGLVQFLGNGRYERLAVSV
jgi:phosphatidylserine/phosphatidylglycerophosphate/cardiolipin synthase-like enzyme